MSIFSESITNTRFVLTLAALASFGLAGFSSVGLILFSAYKGIAVDTALLTVFTTFMGLLGGLVTVAYNSYFKDRAQNDANKQVEAIEAIQ